METIQFSYWLLRPSAVISKEPPIDKYIGQ